MFGSNVIQPILLIFNTTNINIKTSTQPITNVEIPALPLVIEIPALPHSTEVVSTTLHKIIKARVNRQ